MSTKLFGTDGIRARAGDFPLNSMGLEAIGQALGERLRGRLLLGQDTRQSSPWIFERLKRGFSRTTAEIECAGVVPTPSIALLTREFGFAGGVMISASHNPYHDNGIKVFGPDGCKLSDSDEASIEKRVFEITQTAGAPDDAGAFQDAAFPMGNARLWLERYRRLLRSNFGKGAWLKGLHVAMDCANGAMHVVAPSLFSDLGAKVTAFNVVPNGLNINAGCGAVHLEALIEAMRESRADFGVAFDGDGDRSLFVSASGRTVDGDAVLLMMARRLKSQRRLSQPIVVGTQMTNFSLERLLTAEGITLKRVPVGDRFIFEEMQRSGAPLGGEPSGHIIFEDFRLSGDGLLTTLKVAEAIVGEKASLDDLTKDWTPAPQLLKGVRVARKVPIESLPAVQATITDVERELKGRGRLVIRYSGTESLLRVMIESDDDARNHKLMNALLKVIESELINA